MDGTPLEGVPQAGNEEEPINLTVSDPNSEALGFGTPEERIESLEDLTDQLQSEISRVRQSIVQSSPYPKVFLATVNFTDNSFTECVVDNGTASALATPPWRKGPYLTLTSNGSVSEQAIILEVEGSAVSSGNTFSQPYWIRAPLPIKYALFPVAVAATSGSQGTATTASTRVYTVTSLDGVTLGTTMSPTYNRPIGLTIDATHGEGYNNASNVFVLYTIDEVPSTVERSCP